MDEQRFTIVSSSDIIARFRCKCARRLRSHNVSAETVVDKKKEKKKKRRNALEISNEISIYAIHVEGISRSLDDK